MRRARRNSRGRRAQLVYAIDLFQDNKIVPIMGRRATSDEIRRRADHARKELYGVADELDRLVSLRDQELAENRGSRRRTSRRSKKRVSRRAR